MTSLDLALIGNGAIGALVNRRAEIGWACFPQFDGDPVFCSLLRGSMQAEYDGAFAVELIGSVKTEQEYVAETAVVITRFFDDAGAGIQVTDFAPRFLEGGTIIAPTMLARRIERTAGNPSIRIRLRPMQQYGAKQLAPDREPTSASTGTQHLRFSGEHITLRLTTDVSLDAVVNETPFTLDDSATLLFHSDETLTRAASDDLLTRTLGWWRDWVANLEVPAERRDAVVRAAITLKLNVLERTGAIIAAMTTSIPEAPNSTRNWDYRYCWMRDAYFVADALWRLGDSSTTARYVQFVTGFLPPPPDGHLAPMYTVTGGPIPIEHVVEQLPGYRDMPPVRVGNQAYEQIQNDAYGEVILAALPLFTNRANADHGTLDLFERLEPLGDRAANLFDKPDAGLWELRGIERVHTFSSVMCWAGCDALAEIAARLDLEDRAAHWRQKARQIHDVIEQRSWNPQLAAFTAAMEGDTLDASLLLLHPLGFLAADDPRYVSTVRAIGRDLRRGEFIYRYVEKDDFGHPENAFLVCTFWYIDALAAIGEHAEARRLFDHVLSCRNSHGLLAEHVDPVTREQWGNFVQTYSMAGIINSAVRLSGHSISEARTNR